MFQIPSQDRRISQPNNSDVNGNIFATRNIDFDEEGYIKLSAGAVTVYDEDDDADFDGLGAMVHGSQLYILGGDLYRTSQIALTENFTNATTDDTDAPSPGVEEDGVYFNDTEVVTDSSAVKYKNGSSWTTISGTTTQSGGEPNVLEVFPAQNSVLYGTGNKVDRINSSWSVAQTLTLPADYMVTSIAVNGAFAYIGTRHQENGEAMMFLWNGAGTTNDGSFGVGTFEISTVRRYKSSVALVSSLGQLLAFNGSGFTELASLPVYYSRFHWANAQNEYGGISNRGMVVDGDLIYLNISNEAEGVDSFIMANMPGGIWCYDPKIGLYHKYGSTNNEIISTELGVDTADINTSTNVITVSGITVPETGSLVYYKEFATTIGGLIDEKWYYTIKVTDTTFKIAETKQDAIDDNEISLTSGSNSNSFYFIKINDYGQTVPQNRKSVLTLNNTEVEPIQFNRVIYTSGDYNSTGTRKDKLVATSDLIPNRGYFVTPKMLADSHTDVFNSIHLRFDQLKCGDEIVIKYKDTQKTYLPANPLSHSPSDNQVTWTNNTTFTTVSSPAQNLYNFDSVSEGDEVEILAGAGAGFNAHVSSITKSGYQYTVTLDEANPFVSANDKSIVVIDNWQKIDTIDSTYEDNEKTVTVDTQSSWVQFKVELRGTNVRLSDAIVNNRPYNRTR